MRIILAIFAVTGLAAIALIIVIGTGVLHLSSLNRLASTSGTQSAASQPATEPGDTADTTDPADPDAPTTAPDSPEAAPPNADDQSISLLAADANLTGPRIALLERDNRVLRTALTSSQASRQPAASPQAFLAGWDTADDCANWTFDSPAEGTYTVSCVYSAEPGRDKNKTAPPLVLSAGAEKVIFTPKSTTNGNSFEMADAGQLHLPKGQVHLSIAAQNSPIPHGATPPSQGRRRGGPEIRFRLRNIQLFPSQQ